MLLSALWSGVGLFLNYVGLVLLSLLHNAFRIEFHQLCCSGMNFAYVHEFTTNYVLSEAACLDCAVGVAHKSNTLSCANHVQNFANLP